MGGGTFRIAQKKAGPPLRGVGAAKDCYTRDSRPQKDELQRETLRTPKIERSGGGRRKTTSLCDLGQALRLPGPLLVCLSSGKVRGSALRPVLDGARRSPAFPERLQATAPGAAVSDKMSARSLLCYVQGL